MQIALQEAENGLKRNIFNIRLRGPVFTVAIGNGRRLSPSVVRSASVKTVYVEADFEGDADDHEENDDHGIMYEETDHVGSRSTPLVLHFRVADYRYFVDHFATDAG